MLLIEHIENTVARVTREANDIHFKYRKVRTLVHKGEVEKALRRRELEWLGRDLTFWVKSYQKNPNSFDSAEIAYLDNLDDIHADRSSPEARIFQRWSTFPQIKSMLSATGIPKEALVAKIKAILEIPEPSRK